MFDAAEVTVEGNAVSAQVPSGTLRIVGGFELVAGETTALTLDFDAAKSVVVAGPRNVLIKPVVKLLVRRGDEGLDVAKEVGALDESDAGGDGGEADTSVTAKGTVTVAEDPDLGPILVDGEGFSLYILTNDEPDVSTCTGGCARSWPPLIASGDDRAGEGVDPGLVGVITRDDGTVQITYGSRPLYNFGADREPGDTRGQGVGGIWFVISPTGDPITTSE